MAQNETIHGRFLGVMVGDGGDPETFTKYGIGTVSKEISKSLNMGSKAVADKDDPTAVTVDKSWVISKSPRTISMEAEFSEVGYAFCDAWHEAATKKNVRLPYYDEDGTTVLGYFQGSAWLSEISTPAPDEGLIGLSVTLTIDGALTYTTGAPA